MQTPKPLRSVLYTPGSNPRALQKGRQLPADGLIFDLEDAVAPSAKLEARQQARAAALEGGYGAREVLIRVNGLDTPWGEEDVAAVATSGAAGLVLPKVERAVCVREVEALMTTRGAPEGMKIWCMIETPRGVLHAEEIAAATPRIGGLIMGTSDLAKALRCAHTPSREPMLTSLSLCVLAARAAGVVALDGVHLDLSDDAGFAAQCLQGRQLGFDGKTLIHPKTIAAANAAFSPSEAEVAWARRIVAAFAEAEARGEGVVLVDGRLIENLHVDEARRVIALSEAAAR